jgi:competence protein ComEC
MRLHDIAFYTAIFFISGVFVASLVLETNYASAAIILCFVIVFGICYFWKGTPMALVSFSVVLGGLYLMSFHALSVSQEAPLGEIITISGVVRRSEPTAGGLRLDMEKTRIFLKRYPEFKYGDIIKATGKAEEPQEHYRLWFLKDGIAATMRYPEVELVSSGNGNPISAFLYGVKHKVRNAFRMALPKDEALFLSGLVLGETSEFTRDFRDELSRSGTSHLVALSGYNISLIVKAMFPVLLVVFSRRLTFFATLVAILLFVLMTGAEASVVRAAFMGGLMLLAEQVGRVYSFRNAVSVAALLMVLWNPYVLVFDLGFQLSFAALLGIVYLRPYISRVLRLEGEPGFLRWKENLSSTLSAQAAVLPILVSAFGNVSWVGILANILILGVMPAAMFLGLIIAATGLLIPQALPILGTAAYPLFSVMLEVIKFFGSMQPVVISSWTWAATIFYYGVAVVLVMRFLRLEKNNRFALEPAHE